MTTNTPYAKRILNRHYHPTATIESNNQDAILIHEWDGRQQERDHPERPDDENKDDAGTHGEETAAHEEKKDDAGTQGGEKAVATGPVDLWRTGRVDKMGSVSKS